MELLSDKKPKRGLALDFVNQQENERQGGEVIMFDQNEMDITSLEDIDISNVQDASPVMLEKDLVAGSAASNALTNSETTNFFSSNRMQNNYMGAIDE